MAILCFFFLSCKVKLLFLVNIYDTSIADLKLFIACRLGKLSIAIDTNWILRKIQLWISFSERLVNTHPEEKNLSSSSCVCCPGNGSNGPSPLGSAESAGEGKNCVQINQKNEKPELE